MSDQHQQALADYLAEYGRQMVVAGEDIRGRKRRLGYDESRELQHYPNSIAYRLTIPKSMLTWVPAPKLKVQVDGENYTVGETIDMGACHRFVIFRYGQ